MIHSEFELVSDWPDLDVAVAGIVIQDTLGRCALQLRDNFEHVGGAGQWCVFGGHVEMGEDFTQAAIRELNEETGLVATRAELEPFLRFVPKQGHGHQAYHYIYRLTRSVEPREISVGEGAGFAFITQSQIAHFQMLPSTHVILNRLIELNEFAV